jgi:hypothetical protein
VVVHEWGTFTSLQNEDGEALGGINTDDEPLPAFVHRLDDNFLIGPTQAPPVFFQGAPSCHPDVTMRLETPVLYFHLPADQRLQDVTVTAHFRGGWLSEFYPEADVKAPGVTRSAFGRLGADTVSTLAWKDLQVGGNGQGPASTEHVWTAPRAVQAQSVRTADGEAEKFLFYRGVAHIDAPIAVTRGAASSQLVLRSRLPLELAGQAPLPVTSAWLVDSREDGAVAFRPVPPLTLVSGDAVVASMDGRFEPGDYTAANEGKLRGLLHGALVSAGLFDDEARALLDTWELSYFKSAGVRMFFLVPRAWTDRYVPLNVSVAARVTRVMVGRIELVTPQQRNSLQQIGQITAKDMRAEADRLRNDFYARSGTKFQEPPTPESRQLFALFSDVMTGRKPLHAYGVDIPRGYQLYLSLGRFRNALVLDEAARRPAPGLTALISDYGLEGYQPPSSPVQAQ